MKWMFCLLVAAATFASFLIPPAKGFLAPDLARIICFHLPCAISTPIFFFFGSYLSLLYLRNPEPGLDIRATSANTVGYVLAILTMVTGILFSKVQWNAWWQWDPRQTSFLMVLLLYAAYFALRGAMLDERRRAINSAAYSAFASIPAFFLIFVFPRLPNISMASSHPSNTIVQAGFDRYYSIVLSTLFVLIIVLCTWIYRLAVRAGLLELKARDLYGNLEISGGGPAPTGVVRPIPLPKEG